MICPHASQMPLQDSGDTALVKLPEYDGSIYARLCSPCCPGMHLEALLNDVALHDKLEEWDAMLKNLEHSAQTIFIYNLMKHTRKKSTGSLDHCFLGHSLCKAAYLRLLGIGSGRYHRLLAHLHQGFLAPPEDLRKGKGASMPPSEERLSVDKWFQFAWECLAEPMPDQDQEEQDLFMQSAGVTWKSSDPYPVPICRDGFSEWLHAPGASSEILKSSSEVRFLPPACWLSTTSNTSATPRKTWLHGGHSCDITMSNGPAPCPSGRPKASTQHVTPVSV